MIQEARTEAMQLETTDKERVQLGTDIFDLGRMVGAAHVGVMGLEILAHRGGFDFSPIKSRVDEIADTLRMAGDKQRAISSTLHRVNVPVLPTAPKQHENSTNDLAMLSTYGSDDSRELLELLERAQAVAERIDAARGRCVDETMPLLPGESRGTDLAESISVLTLRARKEANGGQSRHE